jgi:glucans biosynthesis protein
MVAGSEFYGVYAMTRTARPALTTALLSCAGLVALLGLCLGLLAVATDAGAAARPADKGFGYADVVERAKALAAKPYAEPPKIPDFLLALDYDGWRDIRFKPAMSLWNADKLPFIVQFFHPGLYYDRAVAVSQVADGKAAPLAFSPEQFDYGRNGFKDQVPKDLGYAGFRVHYPINTPSYKDEVAVFLGASYFRAVGKDMAYGLSARGLALGTATPEGEEFPWFREFWLVRPGPRATSLTLYALLDGPTLAGAYRFVITPGRETVMDVEATLFRRKEPGKIGIAPLTSMFFYGETRNTRPADDFRPEVHDSDGLLLATGTGEWLWRPVDNPRSLRFASFETTNPAGFGLLQRDLDFADYQDPEARYGNRPSAWVAPKGSWGEGRIELVEIPSPNEFNDNILAFWIPGKLPAPGQPVAFAYTLGWYKPAPGDGRPPGARVTATRTSAGRDERTRRFLVDFAGPGLAAFSAGKDKGLTAVVSVAEGAKLVEQQLERIPATGAWRLSFLVNFDPQGTLGKVLPNKRPPPVELRAFLKAGTNAVTETWSYAHQP